MWSKESQTDEICAVVFIMRKKYKPVKKMAHSEASFMATLIFQLDSQSSTGIYRRKVRGDF
jgi:hypothetical protein